MTENNQHQPIKREWHIIYTNPRAEKKVREYLERYKFETFLPIIEVKSRWKDRWKLIQKPLFTSYVFVKISYWDDRNRVLILPGIHHIVFYKGKPATVDEENLNMVDLFAKNFGEKVKVKKMEALQPGRKVKIRYGVLAGREAEVIEMKNKTFVRVCFPMMGQEVTAEVKVEDLGLEELRFDE